MKEKVFIELNDIADSLVLLSTITGVYIEHEQFSRTSIIIEHSDSGVLWKTKHVYSDTHDMDEEYKRIKEVLKENFGMIERSVGHVENQEVHLKQTMVGTARF